MPKSSPTISQVVAMPLVPIIYLCCETAFVRTRVFVKLAIKHNTATTYSSVCNTHKGFTTGVTHMFAVITQLINTSLSWVPPHSRSRSIMGSTLTSRTSTHPNRPNSDLFSRPKMLDPRLQHADSPLQTTLPYEASSARCTHQHGC